MIFLLLLSCTFAIKYSPNAHGILEFTGSSVAQQNTGSTITLPLAFVHGLGDSCYNRGMKQIIEQSGKHIGVYSVCIPTGNNKITDTVNGYFMNMNDNVDEWARRVKRDSNLTNGFHAVGFSQGNSVIRGYIQKYNDPPVHTFLSVHGTVNGVAAFPDCDPNGMLGPVCELLAKVLGKFAYMKNVQDHLFQADYFRDPLRYNDAAYLENSQIAQWNNENTANINPSFRDNFVKVKKFAMIKAMQDTIIFPNEAEWWGEFASGSFKTILKMEDTPNYIKDSFGLKTVYEAGKMVFNTTSGDHLHFTEIELFYWLDNYLVE